jgi:hypothetical protein
MSYYSLFHESVGFFLNNPLIEIYQQSHHAHHPPTPFQASWNPTHSYNQYQEGYLMPSQQY